jgi:hypothetical protein
MDKPSIDNRIKKLYGGLAHHEFNNSKALNLLFWWICPPYRIRRIKNK